MQVVSLNCYILAIINPVHVAADTAYHTAIDSVDVKTFMYIFEISSVACFSNEPKNREKKVSNKQTH